MTGVRLPAYLGAAVLAACAYLAVAPPAAAQAGADCHVYNVLISTPVIHGHPRLRASATVVCTARPDSIHVRLYIQQRVRASGRLRWVNVAFGPADHRIPSPTRRYRLPIGCRDGIFRGKVTIGGRGSDHRTRPNRNFHSVPAVITSCVGGSTARPATATPTAASSGTVAVQEESS